jgi:hypothetical protein
MAFNWMMPSSVAAEMAIGVSQLKATDFGIGHDVQERAFTEQDLE